MDGDSPPSNEPNVPGVGAEDEAANILNLVGIALMQAWEEMANPGLYQQLLLMKYGCGGCGAHLANEIDLVGDVGKDIIESRRMLLFRPNPTYMNVSEHGNPYHITREVYREMAVLEVVNVYCTQCNKQVGYKIVQQVEPQPPKIIPDTFILINGQDCEVPT